MKKHFLNKLCLVMLISFLFSGCSSTESSNPKSNKSKSSSSVSSTSSSTSNTSTLIPTNPISITLSGTSYLSCVYDNTPVIVKDTMYIANNHDNNKIYSRPLPTKDAVDNSKVMKLCDDSSFSMATDTSYIYYSNRLGLSRISLDGKEQSTISNDFGFNLHISGDSLFYINKSDGNRLYKYSISENKSHKATENAVLSYAINGDSIVYINKDDNCRIYCLSATGDDNKVTDYSATSFTIGNNKLYYCNPAYDNRIYTANLDGTQSLPLDGSPSAESLSCDKDGIYFLNHNDFNRLYKITFDGKNTSKLDDKSISSYSLVDKYIIGYPKSGKVMYMIK